MRGCYAWARSSGPEIRRTVAGGRAYDAVCALSPQSVGLLGAPCSTTTSTSGPRRVRGAPLPRADRRVLRAACRWSERDRLTSTSSLHAGEGPTRRFWTPTSPHRRSVPRCGVLRPPRARRPRRLRRAGPRRKDAVSRSSSASRWTTTAGAWTRWQRSSAATLRCAARLVTGSARGASMTSTTPCRWRSGRRGA